MQLLRISRLLLPLLAWISPIGQPSMLVAQTTDVTRGALASRIESEANNFTVPSDETIQRYQAELRDALDELDQFLKRGTPEVNSKWREFLGWDQLVTQTSNEPDTDVLNRLRSVLRSGHPGMERPSFVNVRKAVERLLFSTTARQFPDNFRKTYATRVRQLAEVVAEDAAAADFETLSQISRSTATLEPLGLPREITEKIRSDFFLPNLRILASGEFITRTFAVPVSRTLPVSESLLGTRFTGTARTNGTATIHLVPSRSTARFRLVFRGETISDALGTQRPIRVSSRNFTQARATKALRLDRSGIHSEASVAQCTTRSRVNWIRAMRQGLGSRLIEKIAYKKAEQQRSLAQRIASRRAERKISAMMDEQTNAQLGKANRRWRNRFRPTLEQRAIYPRWVHFSTSSKQLCVHALQGEKDQLGSPTPAPDAPSHSVLIQVHETMPANTATSYMGGMNLTAAMAEELAEQLAGDTPTDLQAEKDWAVKFDSDTPVVLSFRNNQIKVAMTATRFSRGSDSLNRKMEISATYDIEKNDGYVLRRSPEITVSFPGNESGRLGVRDIAQRDLMEKVFASVFGEEFSADSLQVPQKFEKLQDLKLQYISSENGWLSLGWN